jgi:hypothetical protein
MTTLRKFLLNQKSKRNQLAVLIILFYAALKHLENYLDPLWEKKSHWVYLLSTNEMYASIFL